MAITHSDLFSHLHMEHDLLYQALGGRKKPCREVAMVSPQDLLLDAKIGSYSVYAITALVAKINFKGRSLFLSPLESSL